MLPAVEVQSPNHWTTRAFPGKLFIFFFKKTNVIYLFMAALGLCCGMGFSPVAAIEGHSLAVVRGLLIAVTSLVVEHEF